METQRIEITSSVLWRALLIILGVWFFYVIRDILVLFFMAIVIASAAAPIVDKMEGKKLPRTLTTLILYVIFLFCIGYISSLIIPVMASELKQLGQNIPEYFNSLSNVFKSLNNLTANFNFELSMQKFFENISNGIGNSGSMIFSNTVTFIGGFFKVFIVLSLSFYMLAEKNVVQSFVVRIVPKNYRHYAVDLTKRVQDKMGRWFMGQIVLILLIFTLDFIALSVLGVPYALVLATLGGLLEVVPYIGPTIAIIPAALVGMTVSPFISVLVIILYIFIQQAENYLIAPLVMKKAVGLNPVAIILALLIGAKVAGVPGVILAVPVATGLGSFFGDIINSNKPTEESAS